VSQTGGIILLITLIVKKHAHAHLKYKWFSGLTIFTVLYLLSTFIFVPFIAEKFGRVSLPVFPNSSLAPASFTSYLLNRNYVRKELKRELLIISENFHSEFPDSKILYLDANFPFFNQFPLLPHLSHDDGEKVDLALFYLKNNESYQNKVPTLTGYGYYINPERGEFNQNEFCKTKGNNFYDFAGKLVFVNKNNYRLAAKRTKFLLQLLIADRKIKKIFLEPHLKNRLGFTTVDKIRFQGCHSVRHDDHIHIQL